MVLSLLALMAPVASRMGGPPEISREEAEKACAHLPTDMRKACVFDVIATGDLDMAEQGF